MPSNAEPSISTASRRESALAISLLAVAVQVVFQAVLGGLLSTLYQPTASHAYSSVHELPVLLRSVHFWGSALLIAHLLIHIAAATWSGMVRDRDAKPYWLALGLFASTMAAQVTGNLLPFDRHAVQSANAEAAIGSQLPMVGHLASRAMLGGPSLGPQTLTLWYAVHWIVGLAMVGGAASAFVLSRKRARLGLLACLPAVASVLIAGFARAPLGTAATRADYGMYNALPGWYVWPLHGTNVVSTRLFGTGWVGTALLPAILFLFLASLPFLSRRVALPAIRGVFAAFVLVFGAAAVGFGGPVARIAGNRDPIDASASSTATIINPGQDAKLAAQGRQLFNAVGCANCHGADGLQAKFGPSLATVYKEHSDVGFYTKYIHDPAAVDPKSSMPAFPDLKAAELRAFAEFLRFPRKTAP